MKKKYLWKRLSLLALLSLVGCLDEMHKNSKCIGDLIQLETVERKNVTIFAVDNNFDIKDSIRAKIQKLLKISRKNGIENVGFLIISNKPIALDKVDIIKNKIYSSMYRVGYMKSRIIDLGISVYPGAKNSIRIDLLDYNVKNPNCNPWDEEFVGDMDATKEMPRLGSAFSYNLKEMISNKADLIAPRKYIGPANDSISESFSTGASGGSSSSSSSSSNSSDGGIDSSSMSSSNSS